MDDALDPGSVNSERTKYCCYECEEDYTFDKSWKSINDVPRCHKCGEQPLLFCCESDHCRLENDEWEGIYESIFPDQKCKECGLTQQEIEKITKEAAEVEDAWEKAAEDEDRIKRAKAHREREKKGVHQNRIQHTLASCLEQDQVKSWTLMQNPKSCADALRMTEKDYERIKPLIERELRSRGLDPENHLTIGWCRAVITFMERTWLGENKEGLRHGVTADVAGIPRRIYKRNLDPLHIRLRNIRELFDESLALFPTCPAVKVVPEDESDFAGMLALKAVWDDDYDAEDAREIYRRDGRSTLTLPEFLVWEARVGGLGEIPNEKYCDPRNDMGQPLAYVPSDWVGHPREWEEQRQDGFRRWFWMRTGGSFATAQTRGMSLDRLTELSRENMMKCCYCYGLPESNNAGDLILCDCKELLFCSENCKEKVMKIHKFGKGHDSECANCLRSGDYLPTKLLRCARCKKVEYCSKDCQIEDWKKGGHKKACKSGN